MTTYYTVAQFAKKQEGKWPSEGALRALILGAGRGENNFLPAFIRINRRILIDEEKFWECVKNQPKKD
jgi:hypothetical protein